MRRVLVVVAVVLALLVALIGAAALRPWMTPDGTPDDRLLATMQSAAEAAQTALDETGELPPSLDDMLPTMPEGEAADVAFSYERLSTSDIRLCGEFERASSGQHTALPFFDVAVSLHEDLSVGRRRAGRHCYDVSLISTDPDLRADALTFRRLDDTATAIECAFLQTFHLPASISQAAGLATQRRDDPTCRSLQHAGRTNPSIQYVPVGNASIRLCAHFERRFDSSDAEMRIFDPRRDSRFAEFSQTPGEPGGRCYLIRMLLPDPTVPTPISAWDNDTEVELLPAAIRGDAAQDKEAIGDVVNVLRLARCAYTLSGAVPSTFQGAVRTVSQRPQRAERFECGWAPSYYNNNRDPGATYERVDAKHVRACADFRRSWAQPLALNFYVEALADWPTSLPELQRPISEPGRHCFQVRLTAIGSGVI